MPLGRNCRLCDKKFQGDTKYSKLCKSCYDKQRIISSGKSKNKHIKHTPDIIYKNREVIKKWLRLNIKES